MIRTSTLAKTLVLSLAAFAGAGFAATAHAADSDAQVPSATLSTSGMDLTSPAAIRHLQARIRRTAAEICTPYGDGSGRMSADERACYNIAVHTSFADIETRRQLALARAGHNAVAANTDLRPAH